MNYSRIFKPGLGALSLLAASVASGQTNLALNQPATASSSQVGLTTTEVNDGNLGTRWGSDWSDPQWIYIDLGSVQSIGDVELVWEGAFASHYFIQTSDDASTWSDVAEITDGNGGTDTITVGADARYVRMYGTERGSGYGYSLWEFAIYDEVSEPPPSNDDLAEGQPTYASSFEGAYTEALATDGDPSTRWGSSFEDDEWIYVDLGETKSVERVVLRWEAAYGSGYVIQVSDDATNWTDAYTETAGDGGEDDITLATPADGRYVRMQGVTRGSPWGYSLWDFEVYGDDGSPPQPSGDLAAGKTVVASSEADPVGLPKDAAVDEDSLTRWASAESDTEWIYVDLGAALTFDRVVLNWEAAFGSAYIIQVSDDASNWTDVATINNGDGGLDEVTFAETTAQYVRVQGVTRGTIYGYSLWDFEVYFDDDNVEPGGPIDVPLVGPYVEFIDLNLSPDTNNSENEIRVQNLIVDRVLNYDIGTTITVTKDFVSLGPDNDLDISAVDSQGNNVSGFPLTITVYEGLVLTVEVVQVGNGDDLAFGKPIVASSSQDAGLAADFANDGDSATRWGSLENDNEWIYIDLGAVYNFKRVLLSWETAYGSAYNIDVSDDAQNWTTALSVTNGNGQIDDLELDATGRYVRMQGITRGSAYGYSLFDFEVYEEAGYNPDDIIDDPYTAPDAPELSGSFALQSPADNAMINSTRTPTLSWDAVAGATRYDVYMNITKEDYDFTQPGSLLERYTKVGESSTTSFTLASELPDRWTYKWYVVAIDGVSDPRSDIHTFSLYLPNVEQVDDGISLINGMRDLNKSGTIEPYEDWTQPIDTRVDDLLARMTLQEKAMQMFFDGQTYPTAGFHFGPLTPVDEEAMQLSNAATRLGIPAITTGDTIHGYKTTFPTQSALGAMKNYALIRELGDMQRREQIAVGARGTLSPLAEVGTKVLYPRIQEGCGEDADVAAAMVRAILVGLQAGPELNPQSLWVTTKHWPGQGAGGEQQMVYDGTTVHYHMRPWHAAIEAGTGGIMPGYGGTQLFGPSEAGAGDNPYILAYLREELGYEGLICSDWLPSGAWVGSAIAGSDVMGGAAPSVMGDFATEVPEATIDEHVRRILDMKFRLGIFENPYGDYAYGEGEWFTPHNYDLAVQAAREAMTLMTNNGVLPLDLPVGSDIVVTGPFADTGNQWSIWTSGFHDYSGAQTPFDAIAERGAQAGLNVYLDNAPETPDLAVVVVGEPSYTHGTSWANEEPYLPAAQTAIIQNYLNQNVPVVVAYVMARPCVLNSAELSADALLLTYRAGDGGGTALAQVLFGDYVPTGTIPWQLPRSMAQIGTDSQQNQVEEWDIPYDIGATQAERDEIRALIAAGQPVPPIYGDPLFQYGYGLQNYGYTDTTPPTAPVLQVPANGGSFGPDLPSFSWAASADGESGVRHYEVYVDGVKVHTTKGTTWDHRNLPLSNALHTWEVRAVNWAGLEQSSGPFNFTLNDTTAPPAFSLIAPENGVNVVAGAPLSFFWQDVVDTGSGVAFFELYYDGVKQGEFAPVAPLTENANVALDRPYVTSSTNQGTFDAATDGDPTTRWSSDAFAPQSLTIDLGADYLVNRVLLQWEAAYGSEYRIEASVDGVTWNELYYTNTGDGGVDDLTGLSGVARYLNVQCLTTPTPYGFSLWEVEVYGDLVNGATMASPGAGAHNWTVRAVNGAGQATDASETWSVTGQ
ncbi:discoidin domain-containing protein [Cerasicoccus fimbriatus]|uniref:galactose-binding domain-containing protein n=1 Tax=Cerasicoccus fimbriatus TaxID=3014554 RepID=UPI0022B2B832|nr:discoidin domain-containing protein [Cerasicoccus sp. TK19100]